ncbi:MAG: glycosyl hydrolase 108 family protein [Alphaproteobacteria bacterium]
MTKIYEIICESGACDMCKEYSGIFKEIPKHIPPFHPNCKCKLIEKEDYGDKKIDISFPLSSSSSQESDVLKIKTRLYEIGYYIPEEYETTDGKLTPYANECLFKSIGEFQKEMMLPVTRTIKPDDETIKALNKVFYEYGDIEIIKKMKLDEDFQTIMKTTAHTEGGYKPRDGVDRGGETNMGIASHTYPDEDKKTITRLRANQLYYRDYYANKIYGIYKLPFDIRKIVFDNAVNQGQGTAVMHLQKVVGAKADCIVGPDTLKKVNSMDKEDIKLGLKKAIKDRYKNIIKEHPEQIENADGWDNRVEGY